MKKVLFLICLTTITLGILLTVCKGSDNINISDRDQINATMDNLIIAIKNKDINLLISCFTDPFIDAEGNSISHSVMDKDPYWPLDDYDYLEYNNRQITVSGNNATITYVSHEKEKDCPSHDIIQKVTLVRTNSGWLITKYENL